MRLLALVGALLAAGCLDERADGEPAAGESTPIDSIASAAPPAAGPGNRGWTVTPGGAGELWIGMTIDEILPHLEAGVDTTGLGEGCDYVRIPEAPEGTGFMIVEGRLVRIDVHGGSIATREGARVGDSEARILEVYPSARRGPHKYTDGYYLTVLPGAPEDTLRRYVFETDGERVTSFRAGLYPPVEFVEGCS